MTKDRGFKKLAGVTIGRVQAQCINEVTLYSEDKQTKYVISAELGEMGIPVLTLERYENNRKAATIPELKIKPVNKRPARKEPFPWPANDTKEYD